MKARRFLSGGHRWHSLWMNLNFFLSISVWQIAVKWNENKNYSRKMWLSCFMYFHKVKRHLLKAAITSQISNFFTFTYIHKYHFLINRILIKVIKVHLYVWNRIFRSRLLEERIPEKCGLTRDEKNVPRNREISTWLCLYFFLFYSD